MTAAHEAGQVRVEVAGPEAWREVRNLRLAALTEAPAAFASTLAEEQDRPEGYWRMRLGQPDHVTLLALRPGRPPFPAGLAVLGPSADGDEVLGLYSVWVRPEERGRQVGDSLLAAAIAWATGAGARRIVLDVGDANAPAIALYERWGFSPTGRHGALPPPREHITEHELALDLSPRGPAGPGGRA